MKQSLAIFSLILYFGGFYSGISYAAVKSSWDTNIYYTELVFTELDDENLFTTAPSFEVENDIILDNPKALDTVKSIYNSKYPTSGHFKLALANLIRQEQDLLRVVQAKVVKDGILKSKHKTHYNNLLNGFDNGRSRYTYSAVINRRGSLVNINYSFYSNVNLKCVSEKRFVELLEKHRISEDLKICTQEDLEAKEILKMIYKLPISAGFISVIDKETDIETIFEVVFTLDSSDLECLSIKGIRQPCTSTKFSLSEAFKTLNYKNGDELSSNRDIMVYLKNLNTVFPSSLSMFKKLAK